MRKCWFRSSVGLEQQPSKLWVLGSNPNGITLSESAYRSDFRHFFFFHSTAVKLFRNFKKNLFSPLLDRGASIFYSLFHGNDKTRGAKAHESKERLI